MPILVLLSFSAFSARSETRLCEDVFQNRTLPNQTRIAETYLPETHLNEDIRAQLLRERQENACNFNSLIVARQLIEAGVPESEIEFLVLTKDFGRQGLSMFPRQLENRFGHLWSYHAFIRVGNHVYDLEHPDQAKPVLISKYFSDFDFFDRSAIETNGEINLRVPNDLMIQRYSFKDAVQGYQKHGILHARYLVADPTNPRFSVKQFLALESYDNWTTKVRSEYPQKLQQQPSFLERIFAARTSWLRPGVKVRFEYLVSLKLEVAANNFRPSAKPSQRINYSQSYEYDHAEGVIRSIDDYYVTVESAERGLISIPKEYVKLESIAKVP